MCMSGAHPGSYEPVSFWYKYPHILAEKSYPPGVSLEHDKKTSVRKFLLVFQRKSNNQLPTEKKRAC